jgi:outer membrane cobalamin receptor
VAQVALDEDREVSLYSVAGEWEKTFSHKLSGVAGASWNQQGRDDAGDADEWAWLVGARYSLTDNTRLRGSYARQIRFPTLRDLYETGRGNPELEPEKTNNFELALQHDLLDGRSTVEFLLYRVDAKDFIERGLSGVAENFEELRFQGVELNGTYTSGENLRLRMAYTYLDSENRGENAETNAVQNRPEHKLSLRADYDFATGTRFYGAYMYVADALALSRSAPVETTEVGDYNVFDLGVSQSLFNDRVRLIGRVENLFDENYQESFGFPQPGRRFYIGAEFRL